MCGVNLYYWSFGDWGLEIGDWRLAGLREGVKILLGFVGGLRDLNKGGMGKGFGRFGEGYGYGV